MRDKRMNEYHLSPPLKIEGFYPECKVYSDGSHYIAIPHTEKPYCPRPKKKEEVITVKITETSEEKTPKKESAPQPRDALLPLEKIAVTGELPKEEKIEQPAIIIEPNERRMTKKELFNELYQEYAFLKKREKKEKLIAAMCPYFKTDNAAKTFVENNLERKRRNLIMRRIRMTRKANLQTFNFFVTLTYNGELHTEETFKKKLKNTLAHFSSRKSWRYIGVWERSPEKNRLHFHGIFYIPEMIGELVEVKDYSTKSHRMQTTFQNTHFQKHFGRNDFKELGRLEDVMQSVRYLLKYIEKSNERLIYGGKLPTYFVSDIFDDDIICPYGVDGRKAILFDKFTCIEDGCIVGQASEEVIKQMPKCN